MGRFDYLTPDLLAGGKSASGKGTAGKGKAGRKAEKKKKKLRKKTPAPDGRRKGETQERVEAVYIRKETVRAVWREVKQQGGESVSELVEDLLLQWLKERA